MTSRMWNIVIQWRRGILHRGDLPFLAALEDKHMFAGDTFEVYTCACAHYLYVSCLYYSCATAAVFVF